MKNIIPPWSEPRPEVRCSYDKKGKCRSHAQLGRKTVSKRKVWMKKKYGYGWVTKQVVEYHCNQDDVSKGQISQALKRFCVDRQH